MRWCDRNGIAVDTLAASSGGVNTSGGALVPDELSRTIIELVEKYGVFRANADVVMMGSDSLTIPRRTGGLQAFYTAENTAGTESDPSWDNVPWLQRS
jgi:HK97 family phage major capsid protein